MFKNTLIFESAPESGTLSDEDRAWLAQKGVAIASQFDSAIGKLMSGEYLIIALVGEAATVETNKFLRTCQKHLGAMPQWQIIIGNNPSMELQSICQELSIKIFWSKDDVRKTFGPWILEQNRILTDKSDESDKALRMGVAVAQGKFDIIERGLEALKAEAENDFRIAFNLAVYFDKIGRADHALQFFTKTLELNAKFIPAIYLQAQKLLETGAPADALKNFERLELINPKNPDRKALMAQAYADSGNWEKAKEFRDSARMLEADNPLVQELDVRIAFESGDTAAAFQALSACKTTNDYFIRKLNAEAVKLSQSDKGKEALSLYNKAWEIAPESVKFRISYNIALAHYRQNNFDLAAQFCSRAEAECTDPSFDKIEKLRKVLNEKVA